MIKKSIFFFNAKREAIFWIVALLLLYFMNPASVSNSLCVFKWVGFSGCPGCGLGHALHEAMHLNFSLSLHAHPLGIFALLIIILRIYKLFLFKNIKTKYYESQ